MGVGDTESRGNYAISAFSKIGASIGGFVSTVPTVAKWVRSPGRWLTPDLRLRYIESISAGLAGGATLVPFGFWYSSNLNVIDAVNPALRWSMPLAATWLILGPFLLMYQDSAHRKISLFLIRHHPEAKRRIEAANRTTERWPVRAAFVFPFVGVSILAFSIYNRQGGVLVGDSQLIVAFGAFMVLLIGWISGLGIWSGWRSVGLVRALVGYTMTAEGPTFDLPKGEWNPFTRFQDPTVEVTSRFALGTALRFSLGNVFTPALIHIMSVLEPQGDFLVGVAIAALTVSGLILFLYPMWMLRQMAVRWKEESLARLLDDLNVSTSPTDSLTPTELEILSPHAELITRLLEAPAEPLLLSNMRAMGVNSLSTVVFPILMLLIA